CNNDSCVWRYEDVHAGAFRGVERSDHWRGDRDGEHYRQPGSAVEPLLVYLPDRNVEAATADRPVRWNGWNQQYSICVDRREYSGADRGFCRSVLLCGHDDLCRCEQPHRVCGAVEWSRDDT